jgi:hypothetical protein
LSDSTSAAVSELVREAIDVYHDDPVARTALEAYARRLDEPLRVAIAGMVKAGKSTLLNAIIGEEIAPTDAGECTRVVTWYRYGNTPRVTLHPLDGTPRALPIKRRSDGRLDIDLGGTGAGEIDRLVVDWPSQSLREVTLIDTPGIESVSGDVSARTTDFLTPQDAPSEADAIVYLMRHLHASDLNFLESFRDTAAGQSGSVNALAVLSRADEIGGGRVDSLVSARDIAERYRNDDSLRALALGVVPIAGLLAQSARSLRQAEFSTLAELARLERGDRERLLISADRFVRPTVGVSASPEARKALLDRFGLFGIRLASVLIRSGVSEPTKLARELTRRSGLDQLLQSFRAQFQARAGLLRARAALVGVETLLRNRPHTGSERLGTALERIQSSSHEFRELRLLVMARTTGLTLSSELSEEVERLIGGRGVGVAHRLALPENSPATEMRSAALSALHRWRTRAESPLTDRATAEVCHIVVRSCEAVLATANGSVRPVTTRLALGSEPGAGSGQGAGDQRSTG